MFRFLVEVPESVFPDQSTAKNTSCKRYRFTFVAVRFEAQQTSTTKKKEDPVIFVFRRQRQPMLLINTPGVVDSSPEGRREEGRHPSRRCEGPDSAQEAPGVLQCCRRWHHQGQGQCQSQGTGRGEHVHVHVYRCFIFFFLVGSTTAV